MTTASQIVADTGKWPPNTVLYDQSGTNSPTGHRPDCSGFASMCLGLPTPGENTVTLLTKGLVRPIAWADLAPGDVVGALGSGTEGDVGHVMVVTAVDHAAGTYDVMEQGGGYGPDHSVYSIGDGQGRGFLPYRLSTLEDDMVTDAEQCRIALLAIYGATDQGYAPLSSVDPVAAKAISEHNVSAVEARLMAKLDALAAAVAALQGGAVGPHTHSISGTTGPAE